MSRKSEFKENSGSKLSNECIKRQKMSENFSQNFTSEDEKDTSVSVTIYEDDSDLNYFNKSAKGRVLNASIGKRSPLATINKASGSQCAGPSTSTQHRPQGRTPAKFDQAFLKRMQSKELAPDPFQSLSDEILLHIFSFLPKKALNRIAVVNERFYRVIQDESLWIRMDLGSKLLRRGALGIILSRGLIILRLSQTKILSPLFDPTFPIEDFHSKLQYLDLSMAFIETPELVKLLRTCRMLKKLSLEFVPVNDEVCREIAENEKIETLNLAMCEGLTLTGLTTLIPRLQNLYALNISWTNLDTECIDVIVAHLAPSTMRLNIAGCRNSLMDRHIKSIVERCPVLVELDASDCTRLTSVCIPYLSSLTKLEYLSLSRCYNITMTSYLTLNSISTLLYLDVFGLLSESGLQHMERTFKNIGVNKFIHSSVARPTVMPRRTSLWGLRTRD